MALTVVISGLFILPYYFMILMPHPSNTKDYAGNVLRGLDDNGWTNFASSVAQFSVEPDAEKFKMTRDTGEFIDISTVDPQAKWRKKEYYGNAKPGERVKDYIIVDVQTPGKAKAASGSTYDVHEEKVMIGEDKGSIVEQRIDLNFPKQ
jgi:hypothetical protein